MLALEEKTGVKNPRLSSRPVLSTACLKYRAGYAALNNSRQFNQTGLQPFRLQDVLAYIDISGIERGEPAQKFLRIMQAMDSTHLDWWAKKNNKK